MFLTGKGGKKTWNKSFLTFSGRGAALPGRYYLFLLAAFSLDCSACCLGLTGKPIKANMWGFGGVSP